MKKTSTFRVGLLIERSRAFGRELCEGVITFAQARDDWELHFLNAADLQKTGVRTSLDGFIARITTDAVANILEKTGKPVVDLYYNTLRFGFAIVKTRHEVVGRLAAEHFLDRRFKHFAYCPFGGDRTSNYCLKSFTRRLKRDGHDCLVYRGGDNVTYDFGKTDIISDTIAQPKDAKRLAKWLMSLPKPVAVFCPGDLRAWQVVRLCRTVGLDVPHEVAVLGLDNDLLICGSSQPMLSSIDPNTREIGRTAAETLATLMEQGIPQKSVVRQIAPLGVVTRTSTETMPVEPPWLVDAMIYIQHNARKGINASDVFTAVGKSHTTVSLAFRKVLGTSVVKAIADARLEEAQRLLKTSNLDIKQIATLSGYASVSYFMQAFKAATGQAPGIWRRLNDSIRR